MSGSISSRISAIMPMILMISMSSFCWTRVLMNAFSMSTTVTSLCSSASMIHVNSTDYVEMVGNLASFLEIKSLCLLLRATFLPLMVPYLFYFKKIWYSSVYFFCSCDMLFQCSGKKVSLVYSFFI